MINQAISHDNKALVRDFAWYNPKFAIPLIASLPAIPEYQLTCIRLEILAALAMVHCHGREKQELKRAVR